MESRTTKLLAIIIVILLSVPSVCFTNLQVKDSCQSSCGRTSSTYNAGKVSAVATPTTSSKVFPTSWEEPVSSTHFLVYYTTSGTDESSLDYAQNVSDSLENSWTAEVQNYGFQQPPNFPIAVYIKEILSTEGDYGYTWGRKTGSTYSVTNITIQRNIENTDLLHYVCAHELFHGVQLSYDLTAKWYIEDTNDWVIEGTAVWMGAKVYPEYTGEISYVDYASQYLRTPYRPVTQTSYDGVLFWIFLDEHQGGIPTIRDIMQQNETMNSIQAVNETLKTLRDTTFTNVFKEWTIANYFKDSYYSDGPLFTAITPTPKRYEGQELPFDEYIADWGADYWNISFIDDNSAFYMPIQFAGQQPQNVTKILVEHGLPLISDFILSESYDGRFNLTQANNLDYIIIIVRSFGTDTSNNITHYSCVLLGSSYTLNGPYYVASSNITMITINSSASHTSSVLALATSDKKSSQSSSTTDLILVKGSSTQTSSPKTTTIVSKSSSQNSSHTVTYVRMQGDVNGDRVVDILDAGEISAHWYPGPPIGPLGYAKEADINLDGSVDIFDAAFVSANWQRTVP